MNVSYGKKAPEEVNVIIEIPKGTNVKYEFNKESGMIIVDRFGMTTMNYPCNYGFIPSTLAGDGDPVDVLVLSEEPVVPGVILPSRPIALLEMEDENGPDNKLVAVPAVTGDVMFGGMQDLEDIPQSTRDKIKHFFEKYKDFDEGKWVKLRDWKGKTSALKEITDGMKKGK